MDKKINLWNSLVKIVEKADKQEQKDKAYLLLRQYNTAGGSTIMKGECENFIRECGEKYIVWL
jgi:hypothetical protein